MIVKAKCKICNNFAPSDQFKLHFEHRVMVCPSCFSGKIKPIIINEVKKEPEPVKPQGWDKEDDYLERVHDQRKLDNEAQFSKIAGTQHVRCKCAKCKYSFKYDPFQKKPKACPYCNADIPRMRTVNLL